MGRTIGRNGGLQFVAGAGVTDSSPNTTTAFTGITVDTTVADAGESATGKNLQPYIVVYMWKRTA
jgi:hypothetical protein